VGLNFKLDVGLYRLELQVACQRYRQTTTDAKNSVKQQLLAAWGNFKLDSFAPAVA